MNWAVLNFDWNQVRGFLATVETGSLSGAARALGLTQPTLSRQIAALEADLGLVLFERIGRTLVLTPSGLELMDHVRKMGEAAHAMSLAATGQMQAVEGKVRITASDVVSSYQLPPAIAQIRARAPGIDIEIIAANDIRDLQQREADIAIRHVRPTEPELIAKALPDGHAHFYASKAYLDARGRPKTLADLATHDLISPGDPLRMVAYMAELGIEIDPKRCTIRSDNGVAAWSLVREGLGITPMDDHLAARTPDVEAVLPDILTVTFPVWLTTHRELHTSRRIRLVFDTLAEVITSQSKRDRRSAR